MSLDTATMAAPAGAAEARFDRVDGRPELDESSPSLSGWRAALAATVVVAVVVLLASPALAALEPAMVSRAAMWVRLSAFTPVMLGARALVFVVALVVITRPAPRHDGAD
ncbi:MAG TPA: hypothetical protein VFL29_09070 [Candidatus Dormibacteraeota bacterium]|nr:hypothetical protein [Candidatus Dormibacteraeota bacterium]